MTSTFPRHSYQGADAFSKAAAIANGEALSEVINLNGLRLAGIIIPSAWTAANLTFQGSLDGTNFFNLKDQNGSEITAVVSAVSDWINVDLLQFSAVPYLKIRSGTAASAVNQAAGRSLTIIARPV